MIIITGAPSTGKTTLSKKLSYKFNISVLNKDEIKELLFDNVGIKDKDWAMKLGSTSFELTFFFMEKLLQTGKPFIVEGNFDDRYSKESFLDLRRRYHCRILQLYCYAKDEILYKRYINRDNSGSRHPGHIKLKLGFEEYKTAINSKKFKLNIDSSTNIDIDTTDFKNISFHKIYDEVKRNINLT